MVDIPTRKQVIAAIKQAGGSVAAVMPIFYPRELLRAYGIYPIELWGPPNIRSQGQEHFQSYACPIARNANSFLQQGGLAEVDLMLVPHTCDTLQGMGSVLLDFVKPAFPVLTLYHPRGQRDSDLGFLINELKRLTQQLEVITGKQPTNAVLEQAIARELEADQSLKLFYQQRWQYALSDLDFYRVVRAREYLPAEDFCRLLASLPKGNQQAEGVGIALSGIVCEPMSLFSEINQLGAFIAWDDLACGSRRLYQTAFSGTPLEQIAQRLLHTVPEPTKGISVGARIEYLLTQMQQHGAQGLLVYDVKFCEPELFDLPHIKKAMAEEGIPYLYMEHELDGSLSEQMLTRIGAFIEVMQ